MTTYAVNKPRMRCYTGTSGPLLSQKCVAIYVTYVITVV